jgi:hypothetical protein
MGAKAERMDSRAIGAKSVLVDAWHSDVIRSS